MTTMQGSVDLLQDPIALRLLQAPLLARLAYVWHDGTPRVVPIWFHWTGEEIVLGTPAASPKVAALRARPDVALTIDDPTPPWKVLLLRGKAQLTLLDGVAPEFAAAAERFLGVEQGQGFVAQLCQMSPQSVRIAIRPTWVGILDFEQRFPSVLARAMAHLQAA